MSNKQQGKRNSNLDRCTIGYLDKTTSASLSFSTKSFDILLKTVLSDFISFPITVYNQVFEKLL